MKIKLSDGWSVFQDVQNMGDIVQAWNPMFNTEDNFFSCISPWQPIDRLTHLQNLYSDSPYSGHELRQFNAAPWWYKKSFEVSADDASKNAVLCFENIDYFAKVYLNGEPLGEHEGYFAPASFEVGGKLVAGANTVVVKVWSPFDDSLISIKQYGMELAPMFRFLTSEKNMIKGTYDHADGFFQRDINPVGIYGDVYLEFYERFRFDGEINVETCSCENNAVLSLTIPVCSSCPGTLNCAFTVFHPVTNEVVCSSSVTAVCSTGHNDIRAEFSVEDPMLWNIWDRGPANLYTIRVVLDGTEAVVRKFGIRTVEMLRDANTTAFVLNGKRVFLRGTSYFPEVYLSKMTEEHYRSDLLRMKDMGFNAVRVHVHVAQSVFYDLCDELGLAVIQDSDISWCHCSSDAFIDRAVAVFADMVTMLRRHPSIICWITMNEPDMWVVSEQRGLIKLDEKPSSMMDVKPGPMFVDYLKQNDPLRPYIKGSQFENDPESGDTHDYTGSISDGNSHYYDNYGKKFKLLTEFGMDMPGCEENLRSMPKYHERIRTLYEDRDAFRELVEYRTAYLKYLTEYCRIQKNRPCAGYFQFLFSDVTPQSMYGLQDWWGTLKEGAQYCYESNRPVAVLLEHSRDGLKAIWAVNDTPDSMSSCRIIWTAVYSDSGEVCLQGEKTISLPADGTICISDELSLHPASEKRCDVFIVMTDEKGNVLAGNSYPDIFKTLTHPKGHPMRIDHELGMRLFWA